MQVMSRFRGLPFKHAMCMDYPQYTRQEAQTLRDMEYCVAHSDHVMSGVDWVDDMPRWDSLNAWHFAIDTAEWTPAPESEERYPDAPIVIFHAPNHRELKGTRFLIDACEELVAEGEPIELRLVERVPNTRFAAGSPRRTSSPTSSSSAGTRSLRSRRWRWRSQRSAFFARICSSSTRSTRSRASVLW